MAKKKKITTNFKFVIYNFIKFNMKFGIHIKGKKKKQSNVGILKLKIINNYTIV